MSVFLSLTSDTQILGPYTVDGGTIDLNGFTLGIDGNANFGDGVDISGPGIISFAGTVDLDGATFTNFTLLGNGMITNTGFLDATSGNFGEGNLINDATGTIESDDALVNLVGPIAGTLLGAGSFDLGGTFESGLVIDASHIVLGLEGITLAANTSINGDVYSGSGAVMLGHHTLTLAGQSDLWGFYATGGVVDISGSAVLKYADISGALLDVSGTAAGRLQFAEYGGELGIAETGTFLLAGEIENEGSGVIQNAGLLALSPRESSNGIQADITNQSTGTILIQTNKLFIDGLTNDGTIIIDNGFLGVSGVVTADVGASGLIDISGDSTAIFGAATEDDQLVSLSGSLVNLVLQDKSFAGSVAGFAAGDKIDLTGIAATSLHWSGDVLTVRNAAGSIVASIKLTGLKADTKFSLAADGQGGTYIEIRDRNGKFITLPNATQDVWNAAKSGAWSVTKNWSAGTPGADSAVTIAQSLGRFTITDTATGAIDTFQQQDADAIFHQNAGVLSIAAGGTLAGLFNQKAAASLILEAGLLNLAEGGTIGGTLAGAGTIELNGATTLAKSAEIDIGTLITNGTLSLLSNKTLNRAVIGDGTILLDGHTLLLTGHSNLGVAIEGSGTLAVSGSADLGDCLIGTTSELEDRHFMLQYGFVGLETDPSTPVSVPCIDITTGAIYELANSGQIGNDVYNLPVTATPYMENAGLFEATSGGLDFAVFDNAATGTVDAAFNIMEFAAGGTFAGSLTGDGAIVFENATTLAAAMISVATLALNGAGGTATIASPSASFDGVATITGAGQSDLSLSVEAGATVDLANIVFYNLPFDAPPPNTSPGNVVDGPGLTIAFAAPGAELHIDPTVAFDGTIAGFAAGDVIDLAGTSLGQITGETVSGDVLTLTGPFENFSLTFATEDPATLDDITLSKSADGVELTMPTMTPEADIVPAAASGGSTSFIMAFLRANEAGASASLPAPSISDHPMTMQTSVAGHYTPSGASAGILRAMLVDPPSFVAFGSLTVT